MQPALTCIHTGLPNNSISSSQYPVFTTCPLQLEGTPGKAKEHSGATVGGCLETKAGWVFPGAPCFHLE